MADTRLKDAVHAQMVTAMKAGNKERTQVLRMVLSEIKAKESDDVNAVAQVAVVGYAGKLKKALAEMEKLNQAARVAQLKAELLIVDEFLPKPIDDAALEKLVGETLAGMGVGALTKKDSGRAMGAVLKAVAATGMSADSGKVRALLETKMGP